jgi:hypothetical protein
MLSHAIGSRARAHAPPPPPQGVGDLLLDENNVAQVARPGTSLARPATSAAMVRPAAGPHNGGMARVLGWRRQNMVCPGC